MMKKLIFCIILIIFNKVCFSASLVADLSSRSIDINTGFTGAEIFVFGSFDGKKGDELAIAVEGPKAETTLYKKEYISGIWINKASIKFEEIPSFYLITLSDEKIVSKYKKVFKENHLGFKNLNFKTNKKLNPSQARLWQQALESTMEKNGMMVLNGKDGNNMIETIENILFRAPINLPSSVLPGKYVIKVFHLRNGKIHSQKNTSLIVRKTGFEAKIYNFAHNYSIFYGIFAIIMAISAGYIAALMFRKT